jgi:hypothetical protein
MPSTQSFPYLHFLPNTLHHSSNISLFHLHPIYSSEHLIPFILPFSQDFWSSFSLKKIEETQRNSHKLLLSHLPTYCP